MLHIYAILKSTHPRARLDGNAKHKGKKLYSIKHTKKFLARRNNNLHKTTMKNQNQGTAR